MTSIPASRSAAATTFAPRSCPSRPGFATSTRMGRFEPGISDGTAAGRRARPRRGAPARRTRRRPGRAGPGLLDGIVDAPVVVLPVGEQGADLAALERL